MATGIYTRVGGTWKRVLETHTRVGGVWKEVLEGWVKVAGVWKPMYSTYSLGVIEIASVGAGTQTAGITIETGGTVSYEGLPSGNSASDYTLPQFAGVGSDHQARLDVTSGDGPNASSESTGTWLTISSNRTWERETASGTDAGTWRLRIRTLSDSVVVVDQSFNVDTEVVT